MINLVPPTSYSLVLHWHQMRMASIWGDMQILPLAACGRWIPSSRATPAWVAIPPLLLFLHIGIVVRFDGPRYAGCLRVITGWWVLCLLYQASHVLEEEVVHVLLVHLLQLHAGITFNHSLSHLERPSWVSVDVPFFLNTAQQIRWRPTFLKASQGAMKLLIYVYVIKRKIHSLPFHIPYTHSSTNILYSKKGYPWERSQSLHLIKSADDDYFPLPCFSASGVRYASPAVGCSMLAQQFLSITCLSLANTIRQNYDKFKWLIVHL